MKSRASAVTLAKLKGSQTSDAPNLPTQKVYNLNLVWVEKLIKNE